MPFPVTVFDPKNGNADFVVSMDLEKGPGQPGPKDYLYIRNVFVVEEVTPD
jgi:hypothetical protein